MSVISLSSLVPTILDNINDGTSEVTNIDHNCNYFPSQDPEIVCNSSTVTLTGTTLNSVIDDINTLAIAGITASKTAVTGALKITSDNNNFSLTVANGTTGTPLASFGISPSTTNSTSVSKDYYSVWQGTVTNTTYKRQMTEIVKNFTDLGYVITRQKNAETSNATLKWYITW